jgi:alanine racemase
MGRLGLLDTEADAAAEMLSRHKNVEIEGLYTHFAKADEPETHSVSLQQERFLRARKAFRAKGIAPPVIHVANSAAIARFSDIEAHYVRPGITLYGCNPDPSQDFGLALRDIASLKGPVVKLKKVAAGTPVSYGGNYVTSAETYVATVAIGYAHGLPRQLSSKGDVLIGGKRYGIAGNVTMDYIMIDAGPSPEFSVGDEAVAMGYQGAESISADETALKCGTIGYEILCGLSRRIERQYYLGGKLVSREKGILH